MVKIIGEFSRISKLKVWVETHYPTLFEYCYLHPGMWVQDKFNETNSQKFVETWGGCFGTIEIETINRCNGECGFCPVSHGNDPREYKKMSCELFKKVIGDLKDMEFKGWIFLMSNNEPLLDVRIVEMLRYTKEQMPKNNVCLYTNGKLLTVDKFDQIINIVDHFYLDNYRDDLEYTPAAKMVLEYIKTHPEVSDKIEINVTRTNAKRGSRAGLVKNRIFQKLPSMCLHPFIQMEIRPDGKVSLCCNDAIGSYTLGDVSQQTVWEAWNSPEYQNIRKVMVEEGRQGIPRCVNCDNCVEGSHTITKIKEFLGGLKNGL